MITPILIIFFNPTPKEEILIGAILPLTGNGAEQGNAQAKAIGLSPVIGTRG